MVASSAGRAAWQSKAAARSYHTRIKHAPPTILEKVALRGHGSRIAHGCLPCLDARQKSQTDGAFADAQAAQPIFTDLQPLPRFYRHRTRARLNLPSPLATGTRQPSPRTHRVVNSFVYRHSFVQSQPPHSRRTRAAKMASRALKFRVAPGPADDITCEFPEKCTVADMKKLIFEQWPKCTFHKISSRPCPASPA